jgi:hypothetical protein
VTIRGGTDTPFRHPSNTVLLSCCCPLLFSFLRSTFSSHHPSSFRCLSSFSPALHVAQGINLDSAPCLRRWLFRLRTHFLLRRRSEAGTARRRAAEGSGGTCRGEVEDASGEDCAQQGGASPFFSFSYICSFPFLDSSIPTPSSRLSVLFPPLTRPSPAPFLPLPTKRVRSSTLLPSHLPAATASPSLMPPCSFRPTLRKACTTT